MKIAFLILTIVFLSACHKYSIEEPVNICDPNCRGECEQAFKQSQNYNSTLWIQTSTEYRGNTLQSYKLARAQTDKGLKDKDWTAALEQAGSPLLGKACSAETPCAVILDVDETVLDNSPYQARIVTGEIYGFSNDTWNRWVLEQKAKAIPGALKYIKYLQTLDHVYPVFITNRVDMYTFTDTGETAEIEQATINNLQDQGFPVFPIKGIKCEENNDRKCNNVLTKGEYKSGTDESSSEKRYRRQLVANNYRILLLIGDDNGDYVSGVKSDYDERERIFNETFQKYGDKWIVLTNPTYGSWIRALGLNEQNRCQYFDTGN